MVISKNKYVARWNRPVFFKTRHIAYVQRFGVERNIMCFVERRFPRLLHMVMAGKLSLSPHTHTHIHNRSHSSWEKVKKERGKEREGRESVIPGLSLLSPLWVLVPNLSQWGFSARD